VLAFGDSITHGNGAGPEESYPAVLASLTGLAVINAGNPGEVTDAGRERLAALLDTHQPALLLLCHGGNDLLRKIDSIVTRRNLDAMIDMAHTRSIPVLLIGIPQPGLFMLKSAELYREVATRHGLLYDGDILPDVYSDNGLKADQIHPNAAGYRKIAAAIYRLMQDSGLLPG
jgi:lysophospholipase L1-like esterase